MIELSEKITKQIAPNGRKNIKVNFSPTRLAKFFRNVNSSKKIKNVMELFRNKL
jgi:hypothetical protein